VVLAVQGLYSVQIDLIEFVCSLTKQEIFCQFTAIVVLSFLIQVYKPFYFEAISIFIGLATFLDTCFFFKKLKNFFTICFPLRPLLNDFIRAELCSSNKFIFQ